MNTSFQLIKSLLHRSHSFFLHPAFALSAIVNDMEPFFSKRIEPSPGVDHPDHAMLWRGALMSDTAEGQAPLPGMAIASTKLETVSLLDEAASLVDEQSAQGIV